MIVKLPLEKKVKLRDLCLQALRGNTLTIQFVASVIGTLISALPGVEFGRLHYRNLERDKINALARNNGNYRALMRLSETAKQELQWWTTHVMHASRRLRHPVISYIFQTDASDLGWGVTCTTNPQLQSQGLWTSEQRTLHINVRELYVVFICLTIFCTDKSEVHIKFELDNMTAVSYINHMGGCRSSACDTVARKIWAWCISHNIWVTANYIPGPSNVVADSLSRTHLSDHEWQLNTDIFHKLSKKFPKFSIDLFASLLNRQVERYASWHPDPHAAIVDAFSVSWANEYFYAFPPFSLIPKCLEKISRDQAEGVLLVPAWPTQTWYPLLLQMLTQQPKLLLWTPQVELLRHPLGKVHSMQGKLKLMACPLSGNIIRARAFLTTLPVYSLIHGELLHKNSMRVILKNGIYSVVKGKFLHIPLL